MTGPAVCIDRSEADPSLYSKMVGKLSDELVSMPLYVDDVRLYNDPTKAASAEADRISEALSGHFKITFGPVNAPYSRFLSKDIYRRGPDRTTITAKSYINSKMEHFLDKPLASYPASWGTTPAAKSLYADLDEALLKRVEAPVKDQEWYASAAMTVMYKVPDRPDVATAMSLLSRALRFPTRALAGHLTRVLVYLLRNPGLGITYSAHAPSASRLRARVDADWSVRQSTSGFVASLAGATVSHFSRRQHCIAVSTCEAELMALASAALEVLFIRKIMESLGYEFEGGDVPVLETSNPEAHSRVYQHGPVEIDTDSKSAHDLCHRDSAAKNSRHVDRKAFKMRELCGAKKVKLGLVPTAENEADFFTKILDPQPFLKFRSIIMNSAGDEHGE